MIASDLFSIDPADRGQFAWVKQACMFHYIEGFEEAARVLLERIEHERDPVAVDCLVYPLVFVVRHSIELRLKELISEGNRYLGTTEDAWGHDLTSLWESCRRIMIRAQPRYPVAELDVTGAVIGQIHAVDIKADAFRYPTSHGGKPSLASVDGFSLRPLVDAAMHVCEVLNCAAGGIAAQYEFRMDIEREMRVAMAGE